MEQMPTPTTTTTTTNSDEIVVKHSESEKITLFKVFMSEDVIEPMTKVLMSGFLTQGPKVEEFERQLKEFFDTPRLITLNAATSGLTLALRLLIDPDLDNNWPGFDKTTDTVLTTPLTCTATNWPILANGMKLRWVDVNPNNCHMDLDDLRKKITAHTKIIMVVHWGGYPVDLAKLAEIQDEAEVKYGFRPMVIEDSAHAFGATFNNKPLGNHGNICVFSLQAIKHLTTGDGGIIILPNETLYERSRLLRWYGIDRAKRNFKGKDFRLEHDIEEWGYKFHMNDVNATMGLANLPHMKDNLGKCRYNGAYYDTMLLGLKNVRILEDETDRESAFWLYTIGIKNDLKPDFLDFMNKECNVMVSQVHQRNDVHSCVKEFEESLPQLDKLEREIVCIPVGWWVSIFDRRYIVRCIKEWDDKVN